MSETQEQSNFQELEETLPTTSECPTIRSLRVPKDKPLAMKPIPGFAWNPLLTLPRNMNCPCKSGRKFKHCHLNLLPRVIKQDFVETYKQQMKRSDLIFLTKENEKQIQEMALEVTPGASND